MQEIVDVDVRRRRVSLRLVRRASGSWARALQQGSLNARWGSGRSRNPAALAHTPKKCGLQARR